MEKSVAAELIISKVNKGEEQKYVTHSIKKTIAKKDEKILKQMIDSVSPQFNQLLEVACKGQKVSEEAKNYYLENWAKSKYEFYLMFGKKLSIEQDIKIAMKPSDMNEKRIDLAKKFTLYAMYIMQFSAEEFIDNIAKPNADLEKYEPKFFKAGMKISKFFSQRFENNEFDIELSKILQNRFMVGKIVMSINPCDYITMSVNNHNWHSCQQIGGQYGTAAFSLMLDDSTIISYKTTPKEYEYDLSGVKFTWNSKQIRRLVFFDKETCKIGFSRLYPTSGNENKVVDEFKSLSRELLETAVSKYLEIPNNWDYCNREGWAQQLSVGGLHYTDGIKELVLPANSENKNIIGFKNGVKSIKCLCCNRTLTEARSYLTCH